MVGRRSFNPAFSGRRKTPPSCGRRNQTRQHERIIINAILETSQKPRGRIPSPKCTHAQILKSQILGKARVRQKAKKRKREDAICITWCSCVTDLEGIFLNAKAAFLPCVSATLFLFRDERHQKKFTADTRNNAFFSARTLHWRIFFPNHNATRWIRYPAQKSGFLLLKKQFFKYPFIGYKSVFTSAAFKNTSILSLGTCNSSPLIDSNDARRTVRQTSGA